MRRDERFEIGERAQLDVDVAAGSLQVQEGPAGAIRVSIDSPKADEFELTQIGDTVTISESSRWLSRNRAVRIAVELPMRAGVTITGASLDVLLRGAFSGVRCRTASGDLEIDEVDRLDVSTASGDVRVRLVNGDAGFNTASGDVNIATMLGRLTAQLASGDLVADSVGASVDVGTASGGVRIGRCGGSDINVKTVSGNIRLGLPAGIRVEPEISTMSGRVALPPAASTPVDRTIERRSVRVRLRTVSGDIRIDRVG